MRFSVQGDYVFDRVLVSKEKALWAESFLDLEERTTDGRPYRCLCGI